MHGSALRWALGLVILGTAACEESKGGRGGFLPGGGGDDGGMEDGGTDVGPSADGLDFGEYISDDPMVTVYFGPSEGRGSPNITLPVHPTLGFTNVVGWAPAASIIDRVGNRILYERAGVVKEAVPDVMLLGGSIDTWGRPKELVADGWDTPGTYHENDIDVETECPITSDWFVEPDTGAIGSFSENELCVDGQPYPVVGSNLSFIGIGAGGYFLTRNPADETMIVHNYMHETTTPVIDIDSDPVTMDDPAFLRPLGEGWAMLVNDELWMVRYEDAVTWKVGEYSNIEGANCGLAADSTLWCNLSEVYRNWSESLGVPAGNELVHGGSLNLALLFSSWRRFWIGE